MKSVNPQNKRIHRGHCILSADEIRQVLRQAWMGMPRDEICERFGISLEMLGVLMQTYPEAQDGKVNDP